MVFGYIYIYITRYKYKFCTSYIYIVCTPPPPQFVGKKFETFFLVIFSHPYNFLDQEACLNSTQHAFSPGHSCLPALLDVFHNIMHMLDSNSSVDMVHLDVSKAFDKVDHGIRAVRITGNICIRLFHFLTDRSHCV